MPRHPNLDDEDDEVQPYKDPDVEAGEWPEEWTPRQRENWRDHGEPVYSEIETDVARYWYKKTWRPKMQGEGLMETDAVTFGNPEDYIAENVSDMLSPMGDMTSMMMRQVTSYGVEDDLDEVVNDIVRARIRNMSEEQQARLLQKSKKLAGIYGIDQ